MSIRGTIKNVILIVMDDVRASHLFDLMKNGKAPNIAKLASDGISCENCVTSYPSITFPCYANIMTGTYSGYYPIQGSGIPEYHYVRRTDPPSSGERYPKIMICVKGSLLKINREIGTNCKTIFEQAGEGEFLSSLNYINRGSLLVSPNPYTTETILKNVEVAFKNPRKFQFNEPPLISVAYIPQTDDIMHNKGFDKPEYINEILKADKGIGRIGNTLKETGYYDSTVITIISDHGNYKAKQMYDLKPFFDKLGLNQYNPKKGTGDFDAVFGSVGFFNVRGKNWHHHPSINELENFQVSGGSKDKLNFFDTLWKIPGVKYMYYRDDNNTPDKGTIHVQYRDEQVTIFNARIEYEGHGINQKTKYIFDDLDVYGYELDEDAAKILDGKPHDIDEWLKFTNRVDFPMIIDQVPRYFKNPRSGDILISTLGEYGFNFEHGKTMGNSPYMHDICLRKSMIVPFIIGGSPEIPRKVLDYCKTTDMVPTLLHLLGKDPDKSVVGKSILN
jgi:arylsulfatase A-like enzyme